MWNNISLLKGEHARATQNIGTKRRVEVNVTPAFWVARDLDDNHSLGQTDVLDEAGSKRKTYEEITRLASIVSV